MKNLLNTFSYSSIGCAVLLAVFGCSNTQQVAEPQGYVVTIPPVAMILQELVGEQESIAVLLRPGASPHTYEISPGDAKRVQQARALVYVAEGLDAWAANLDAHERIAMFEFLAPDLKLSLPEEEHAHDGHDHGHYDPHFWLDPLAVKSTLQSMSEILVQLKPDSAELVKNNVQEFSNALDELDKQLRKILSPLKGKKMILHHPSFRYFLKRYDIEVAGYIETSPGKEPSPQEVARLIELIKREDVAVICTEPQLSRQAAQVVAEGSHIPVVELDPLGGRNGLDTYAELLFFNVKQLRSTIE